MNRKKSLLDGMKRRMIDITDARCPICGEPVKAEMNIGKMYTFSNGKAETYMSNGVFFTCWGCEKHGAVGAVIDGRTYSAPTDLMDMKEIKIDGMRFVRVDGGDADGDADKQR